MNEAVTQPSPTDASAPINRHNEAAERLLPRISGLTHDSNATYIELRDLLDAALATERRNTVERIRDYYDFDKCPIGLRLHIDAIFDETEPPAPYEAESYMGGMADMEPVALLDETEAPGE